MRLEPRLDRATGSSDPLARWLALLMHHGLAPDVAHDAWRAEREIPLDFSVDLAVPDLPPAERVALLGAMPVGMAAALVDQLGERAEAFVEASNTRAPVVLRTRDPEAVLARLLAADIDARRSPWAPNAIIVPPRTHLPGVPGLRPEDADPQDTGSQLIAELVALEPGHTVVDFCAGAGGKTLAMADLGPRDVRRWASDVRPRALRELQKRARQSAVRVTTAVLSGGGLPPAFTPQMADRVLVDAPCSGSGVWRRHPELRWRLDDLDDTRALQASILDLAATLVKPGGRLIYATCSVLRSEDEDQTTRFLADHPRWSRLDATEVLGEARAPLVRDGYLRTWPHEHGIDGFFAAVLVAPR